MFFLLLLLLLKSGGGGGGGTSGSALVVLTIIITVIVLILLIVATRVTIVPFKPTHLVLLAHHGASDDLPDAVQRRQRRHGRLGRDCRQRRRGISARAASQARREGDLDLLRRHGGHNAQQARAGHEVGAAERRDEGGGRRG